MPRLVSPVCYYKRNGSDTIYARDRDGRYNCFTVNANQVRLLPGGITRLAPIFARVDFGNRRRFTSRVSGQATLRNRFDENRNRINTNWSDLPNRILRSGRSSNQGMNRTMENLTGQRRSATEYAQWCAGLNQAPARIPGGRWEWCHLLAHSMGGRGGPNNIVAAVRGNNSEQLAIESALLMYRQESIFEMKISATHFAGANFRYVGDVIRYRARCIYGGQELAYYLDCLYAPRPSAIHFYRVLRFVASWANGKIMAIARSQNTRINRVSAQDKRLIQQYIAQNRR